MAKSRGRKKRKRRTFQCHWCEREVDNSTGRSLSKTRDHVIPKSKGGHYTVISCLACNNLKGSMWPKEWRAFRNENPRWWCMWKERSLLQSQKYQSEEPSMRCDYCDGTEQVSKSGSASL